MAAAQWPSVNDSRERLCKDSLALVLKKGDLEAKHYRWISVYDLVYDEWISREELSEETPKKPSSAKPSPTWSYHGHIRTS